VLSDVGNHVARSFGLVYALPEELRATLRSNNKALPGINGDDTWELPVPATYVIAAETGGSRSPISTSIIASGLSRTRSWQP
jgi:hypothetical protein